MATSSSYKIKNIASTYIKNKYKDEDELTFISCEMILNSPEWISYEFYGENILVKNKKSEELFVGKEVFFHDSCYLEIFNLKHFDHLQFDSDAGVCGSTLGSNEFEKNSRYFFTDGSKSGLMHRIWMSDGAFKQLLLEINAGNHPKQVSFSFSDVLLVPKGPGSGLSFVKLDGVQAQRIAIESFHLDNQCSHEVPAPLPSVFLRDMAKIQLYLILIIALLVINLLF